MTTTPADFKIRFPEYASEADARIQLHLDDAALQMNEAFWGVKYDLGMYYLAAHLLWVDNEGGGGSQAGTGGGGQAIAPIASQTVDGVNVTYTRTGGGGDNRSGLSQADIFYSASTFGQRYLALRKTLGTVAYAI